LGATARLLCTTASEGTSASICQGERVGDRSHASRMEKRRRKRRRTTKSLFCRSPRGETGGIGRTSRGFLADEPEGRLPAPLPHGVLVLVHRVRGVRDGGAARFGGDSNRTRRFSFASTQIRRRSTARWSGCSTCANHRRALRFATFAGAAQTRSA
jgi:hypothetical protein